MKLQIHISHNFKRCCVGVVMEYKSRVCVLPEGYLRTVLIRWGLGKNNLYYQEDKSQLPTVVVELFYGLCIVKFLLDKCFGV